MSLSPTHSQPGRCIIAQVLLILIGLTASRVSALDLKPSPSDYRSLRVEFIDPLPGLELHLSYGAFYSRDESKLEVKEFGDQGAKFEIALSENDVATVHGMLRTIAKDFRLEDSPTLDEKLDLGTIPFRLRISTPESSMEFAYLPHDRPRSDAAATCYFWLLRKLPPDWQKKTSWMDQFELWKPKASNSPPGTPLDSPVTILTVFNPETREANVFTASRKDVDRISVWQTDVPPALKTNLELVELAKSRIKDYGLDVTRKEVKSCSAVDWRRHELGNGWFVFISFMTGSIFDPTAPILPRDDGRRIDVPMLPDGTPIKTETRPMTDVELEDFGFKPRTSPRDPRFETPADPFAPPPSTDKSQAK